MIRRDNSLATALLSMALLTTASAAADFTGHYPVEIEVNVTQVDGLDCITSIARTNPMRLVVEKGQHPDWFKATPNVEGPRIKWSISQPVTGYKWTIAMKGQTVNTPSNRRFFGTLSDAHFGIPQAAKRTNLADNLRPALKDARYCWFYYVKAEFRDSSHANKCIDAGHPALPKLDPQVVFNGGGGAAIIPDCKGDTP